MAKTSVYILRVKTFLRMFFLVSVIACQQNAQFQHIQPVNYIVLLDLSDRITRNGVIEADKQMILQVFDQFVNQVRNNLTINSSDKFTFRILPQKTNPFILTHFENTLSIDMKNIPVELKNSELEKLRQILPLSLDSIYDIAFIDSNTSSYFGSDIWKYFHEQLTTDLSPDAVNFVVVLTDGYFDFENDEHALREQNRFTSSSFYQQIKGADWKHQAETADFGLIPLSFRLSFKCIVAGLHPKSSSLSELDKISYFWQKWMKESGNIPITLIPFASYQKMNNLLSNALNQ